MEQRDVGGMKEGGRAIVMRGKFRRSCKKKRKKLAKRERNAE